MESILIEYKGELRTEVIHLKSGNRLVTDAPTDNHGKGESFSPTDLLCVALGTCMMTVMGIAANAYKIKIDGCLMKITKIMANNPRRVAEAIIDFSFAANDFSQKEKAILEEAALTCPVALSVHPDLKQTVKFNYGI